MKIDYLPLILGIAQAQQVQNVSGQTGVQGNMPRDTASAPTNNAPSPAQPTNTPPAQAGANSPINSPTKTQGIQSQAGGKNNQPNNSIPMNNSPGPTNEIIDQPDTSPAPSANPISRVQPQQKQTAKEKFAPTNNPQQFSGQQSVPKQSAAHPENSSTKPKISEAKDAPPIHYSSFNHESNKAGLIVAVAGFFAVIFGILLFAFRKNMGRNQLESPDIGVKDNDNNFNTFNGRLEAKTIDFTKPKMLISETLINAARKGSKSIKNSINYISNTLSRNSPNLLTTNESYPINVDPCMRFNWPIENVQGYNPAPESFYGDGYQQYCTDEFAYPVDPNLIVENPGLDGHYNIYPQISSSDSRNTENSFGYFVPEALYESVYLYNEQNAAGFVYSESSMQNNYPQNSLHRPLYANRCGGFEHPVDLLNSEGVEGPVIVQVENSHHISSKRDQYYLPDEIVIGSSAGEGAPTQKS